MKEMVRSNESDMLFMAHRVIEWVNGGIFDMHVRISGDRDRRKLLSLKGRDTIQGVGLLRGGA